jgi:hypothetical protein
MIATSWTIGVPRRAGRGLGGQVVRVAAGREPAGLAAARVVEAAAAAVLAAALGRTRAAAPTRPAAAVRAAVAAGPAQADAAAVAGPVDVRAERAVVAPGVADAPAAGGADRLHFPGEGVRPLPGWRRVRSETERIRGWEGKGS